MEISSPIPRQQAGKTFSVAISLLGLAALLQLGAGAWAFIQKYHATAAIEPALPVKIARGKVDAPPEKLTLVDPFEAASITKTPAAAASPAPSVASALPAVSPAPELVAALPKPTPLPVQKPTAESRLTDLLEQARALREKGDTSTALTRLREAQAMAPDSSLIISELATTFEKMGQPDKALEQWRRIYDMGETAGIYFQAADAKLKASETAAQSSPKPEESVGIQPGSVLGLTNLTTLEQSDPASLKKFMLKIPVKVRPKTPIAVKDVVLQVFFYDTVKGETVVQTNANVTSRWSTLPVDWKEDEVEILEVEYTQPLPKSGKPAEPRQYFGYVVRIYYKNDLQDMRAEPVKLLKQFPPPLTLSSTEPAP